MPSGARRSVSYPGSDSMSCRRRPRLSSCARLDAQKLDVERARTDGLLLRSYGSRPVEWYTIKDSMLEERLEQVREIDGELAYEKMRRAVEKASQQEKARQETARQTRERRGPERGGPERDFGPSR